jgi:hypothetical protein
MGWYGCVHSRHTREKRENFAQDSIDPHTNAEVADRADNYALFDRIECLYGFVAMTEQSCSIV